MAELTSLIGKPIDQLTPAELEQVASQLAALSTEITTRQKAVRETAEKEQFGKIAVAAVAAVKALAWQKLPKLTLVPNVDGNDYIVAYAATKVRATGKGNGEKRAASEVNTGAITINKIALAMGGIAWFKAGGKEYEGQKDLVKNLKNPKDGTSEADRCWDISKKGISASDILTRYHADEVTLVFNDSTEMLLKDAVDKMKDARKIAEVSAVPAAPAPAQA